MKKPKRGVDYNEDELQGVEKPSKSATRKFLNEVRVLANTVLARQASRETPSNPPEEEEGLEVPEIKGSVPLSVFQVHAITATREYLRTNKLEFHAKALHLMERARLTAQRLYNQIHRSGEAEFSESSEHRVNRHFVDWILEQTGFTEEDVIGELGSGYGNDAIYLAKNTRAHEIIGADASDEAIRAARQQVEDFDLEDRVSFLHGNYLQELGEMRDRGCQTLIAHSTLHYQPGLVLKKVTFPLLAHVLRQASGEKGGQLFLAMKTIESDSAGSEKHIRLAHAPYYPSIERKKGVFRVYPTEEAILDMISPSFDIAAVKKVRVPNYDVQGEEEVFLLVRAVPKKEVRADNKTS